MLAPHELKNRAFSKAVRGYNPTEVDDHIDFLVEKYTELYRENNELNRKLRIVVTKLDEIKDEEESIRSTLVNAQKMGEKIIRDANDKADIITGAIKERCDAIIADFKRQLVEEKEEMWLIRTTILDFKKDVFELYRKHIEELQAINVNELEDIVLPNENTIVEGILSDVSEAVKNDLAEQKKIEDIEDINHGAAVAEEQETVSQEPAVATDDLASHFESPEEPANNNNNDDDDDEDEDLFIKSLKSTE